MEHAVIKTFDIESFDIDNKKLLGRGSFATAYKVRFIKDSSTLCVLKKPHALTTQGEKEKRRNLETEKEIALLYNIEHNNVIGLFGRVHWSDRWCLVLEYALYGTVYDHLYGNLENTVDLNEKFKENTIRGVCCGLKHLHTGLSKPIRHGDIKSPNVLLCDSKNEIVAKISDFGFSDELTSTNSGDGKCSYRWAAPEVVAPPKQSESSKTVKSIKSDIWSLGAFVWEIWEEKLPYSNSLSSSGQELLCQIVFSVGREEMKPYNPDTDKAIPEFYRVFLLNCFEFDRQKRWDITDVCEYLDPVASGLSDMEAMELNESVQTNSDIPIEMRHQYTQACFHLINALSRDANLFATVKNLFRTEIPISERELIRSPDELLDFLERQAFVSVGDTSLLQTRLRMIGEDGERLANGFCTPTSTAQQARTAEGMETERGASAPAADVSQTLAAFAVGEIARPLRRSLKDNHSTLEELMSKWISRETKPGLNKVGQMLGRLQSNEEEQG